MLVASRRDHRGAGAPRRSAKSLRRIVYGVLLWRDGRFRFVPGEDAAPEDIRLDLDLDRLILEGLRLADQKRAS